MIKEVLLTTCALSVFFISCSKGDKSEEEIKSDQTEDNTGSTIEAERTENSGHITSSETMNSDEVTSEESQTTNFSESGEETGGSCNQVKENSQIRGKKCSLKYPYCPPPYSCIKYADIAGIIHKECWIVCQTDCDCPINQKCSSSSDGPGNGGENVCL